MENDSSASNVSSIQLPHENGGNIWVGINDQFRLITPEKFVEAGNARNIRDAKRDLLYMSDLVGRSDTIILGFRETESGTMVVFPKKYGNGKKTIHEKYLMSAAGNKSDN